MKLEFLENPPCLDILISRKIQEELELFFLWENMAPIECHNSSHIAMVTTDLETCQTPHGTHTTREEGFSKRERVSETDM